MDIERLERNAVIDHFQFTSFQNDFFVFLGLGFESLLRGISFSKEMLLKK